MREDGSIAMTKLNMSVVDRNRLISPEALLVESFTQQILDRVKGNQNFFPYEELEFLDESQDEENKSETVTEINLSYDLTFEMVEAHLHALEKEAGKLTHEAQEILSRADMVIRESEKNSKNGESSTGSISSKDSKSHKDGIEKTAYVERLNEVSKERLRLIHERQKVIESEKRILERSRTNLEHNSRYSISPSVKRILQYKNAEKKNLSQDNGVDRNRRIDRNNESNTVNISTLDNTSAIHRNEVQRINLNSSDYSNEPKNGFVPSEYSHEINNGITSTDNSNETKKGLFPTEFSSETQTVTNPLEISHEVQTVTNPLEITHEMQTVTNPLEISHEMQTVTNPLEISHEMQMVTNPSEILNEMKTVIDASSELSPEMLAAYSPEELINLEMQNLSQDDGLSVKRGESRNTEIDRKSHGNALRGSIKGKEFVSSKSTVDSGYIKNDKSVGNNINSDISRSKADNRSKENQNASIQKQKESEHLHTNFNASVSGGSIDRTSTTDIPSEKIRSTSHERENLSTNKNSSDNEQKNTEYRRNPLEHSGEKKNVNSPSGYSNEMKSVTAPSEYPYETKSVTAPSEYPYETKSGTAPSEYPYETKNGTVPSEYSNETKNGIAAKDISNETKKGMSTITNPLEVSHEMKTMTDPLELSHEMKTVTALSELSNEMKTMNAPSELSPEMLTAYSPEELVNLEMPEFSQNDAETSVKRGIDKNVGADRYSSADRYTRENTQGYSLHGKASDSSKISVNSDFIKNNKFTGNNRTWDISKDKANNTPKENANVTIQKQKGSELLHINSNSSISSESTDKTIITHTPSEKIKKSSDKEQKNADDRRTKDVRNSTSSDHFKEMKIGTVLSEHFNETKNGSIPSEYSHEMNNGIASYETKKESFPTEFSHEMTTITTPIELSHEMKMMTDPSEISHEMKIMTDPSELSHEMKTMISPSELSHEMKTMINPSELSPEMLAAYSPEELINLEIPEGSLDEDVLNANVRSDVKGNRNTSGISANVKSNVNTSGISADVKGSVNTFGIRNTERAGFSNITELLNGLEKESIEVKNDGKTDTRSNKTKIEPSVRDITIREAQKQYELLKEKLPEKFLSEIGDYGPTELSNLVIEHEEKNDPSLTRNHSKKSSDIPSNESKNSINSNNREYSSNDAKNRIVSVEKSENTGSSKLINQSESRDYRQNENAQSSSIGTEILKKLSSSKDISGVVFLKKRGIGHNVQKNTGRIGMSGGMTVRLLRPIEAQAIQEKINGDTKVQYVPIAMDYGTSYPDLLKNMIDKEIETVALRPMRDIVQNRSAGTSADKFLRGEVEEVTVDDTPAMTTWNNPMTNRAGGSIRTLANRSMNTLHADEAVRQAMENTVNWVNPAFSGYGAPESLTFKNNGNIGDDQVKTQQRREARISEAEIRRTADRVFKMVEERIRKERRRIGRI